MGKCDGNVMECEGNVLRERWGSVRGSRKHGNVGTRTRVSHHSVVLVGELDWCFCAHKCDESGLLTIQTVSEFGVWDFYCII